MVAVLEALFRQMQMRPSHLNVSDEQYYNQEVCCLISANTSRPNSQGTPRNPFAEATNQSHADSLPPLVKPIDSTSISTR